MHVIWVLYMYVICMKYDVICMLFDMSYVHDVHMICILHVPQMSYFAGV